MLFKIVIAANTIIIFACQIGSLSYEAYSPKELTTDKDAYQVTVEQGTLAGEVLNLITGEGQYYSFKGIPYAQPPIGSLRFKVPLPAKPWSGIRNATQHGSICPQKSVKDGQISGHEDCLFLNVYTPNLTPRISLPVLFFIHEGAFKRGSGDEDFHGPDFFMRKDFDIVLVTINYRLDTLGFLSLGTEDIPGNAGLKDQVLALKWVQKNIDKFGGDPTKVTIMGQSAGSASVGFHLVSPMSAGLFHKAIALSGSPYCDWAVAHRPEMRAFKLGKQLGFDGRETDALLSFLQNVTAERLVNYTNPNVLASEEITAVSPKFYHFLPNVEKYYGENNFISENLFHNLIPINEVDILFGYTNQEALILIAYNAIRPLLHRYDSFIENFAPTNILEYFPPDVSLDVGTKVRDYYMGNKSINIAAMKEFITYFNDGIFKYNIIRYFSKMSMNRSKYMYQFSAMSNRTAYGLFGAPYNITGAAHSDDLKYLFNPKSQNYAIDMNSIEFEIIVRFTTIIKNFVHFGKPATKLTNDEVWPEFDESTLQYVDIGTNNSTVFSVNDEPFYKFWSDLFESIGFIY